MRIWLAIPSMKPSLLSTALLTAADTSEQAPAALVHANGVPIDLSSADFGEVVGAYRGLYQTYSPRNLGVVPALSDLWKLFQAISSPDDIIAYTHDDVLIQEASWDTQLVEFFGQHPQVGLVGFHGARGLGQPDLYKIPFNFPATHSDIFQLARLDCISNMRDAHIHGRRYTEPARVATIDGFSMFCRRVFLEQIRGWDWWPKGIVHHSYDNALACMAARYGWETWMYPIACHHNGGVTSTSVDFLGEFGESEGEIHARSHVFLYNNFKDVLPLRVS